MARVWTLFKSTQPNTPRIIASVCLGQFTTCAGYLSYCAATVPVFSSDALLAACKMPSVATAISGALLVGARYTLRSLAEEVKVDESPGRLPRGACAI